MTTTKPRAPAPAPLRIDVSFPLPGTARLSVAGEVDLPTAPMLGMRLLTVIEAHHPAVVDVDLGEVAFMHCSGIGVLAAVPNAVEHVGCQI
jgi:anti-anti-sigma factor